MSFELVDEETASPMSQDVTAAALAVCEAVVREGRYLPHTLAAILPQAQAALELARRARTPVGQIANALAAQRPSLPLRVCSFCGWRRAESDGLCVGCGMERLRLTLMIARALARQGERAREG